MKKHLTTIVSVLAVAGTSFALPLQLNVRTDKQVYDLGEIITVNYKIINRGDDPIIMFGGDTCFHYRHLYETTTGEPLRLIDPLPSSGSYRPFQSLILLLDNESFENVLEMKFEKTADNKLFVWLGIDRYWVPNEGVNLKAYYSKNTDLNKTVFEMWKLPLYEGDDLEAVIRFRLLNNKVVIEEVPKSKEQQEKEDEQRKVEYYSDDGFWGTIKRSYTLVTVRRGECDTEVEELLLGEDEGSVTNK